MCEEERTPISPKDLAFRLLDILTEKRGDPESAHSIADGLLCEALESLGYEVAVQVYKKVRRWYA